MYVHWIWTLDTVVPRDDENDDYISILFDQLWESEVDSDPHITQDLQNLQFDTSKDYLSKKEIPFPAITEYYQDLNYEDPQSEMLCWHYWLGHHFFWSYVQWPVQVCFQRN